eukprot:2335985-Pleurochrysis_carterae.AAC.1
MSPPSPAPAFALLGADTLASGTDVESDCIWPVPAAFKPALPQRATFGADLLPLLALDVFAAPAFLVGVDGLEAMVAAALKP